MSRWLVGSSMIRTSGRADQSPADRQPLAPAAGEQAHRLLRVRKLGPAEQGMHPVVLFCLVDIETLHSLIEVVDAVGFLVENVLLGHIADAQQLLDEDRAAVGLLKVAEDFEQGRFARTVGPDQADFVAGIDHQGGVSEQNLGPESLGQALATEKSTHVDRIAGYPFPVRLRKARR